MDPTWWGGKALEKLGQAQWEGWEAGKHHRMSLCLALCWLFLVLRARNWEIVPKVEGFGCSILFRVCWPEEQSLWFLKKTPLWLNLSVKADLCWELAGWCACMSRGCVHQWSHPRCVYWAGWAWQVAGGSSAAHDTQQQTARQPLDTSDAQLQPCPMDSAFPAPRQCVCSRSSCLSRWDGLKQQNSAVCFFADVLVLWTGPGPCGLYSEVCRGKSAAQEKNLLSCKSFQKKRERKKLNGFELSSYWIVFTPAIALCLQVMACLAALPPCRRRSYGAWLYFYRQQGELKMGSAALLFKSWSLVCLNNKSQEESYVLEYETAG